MKIITICLAAFLIPSAIHAQNSFRLSEDFDKENAIYEKTGRGIATIANSVLTTKDAYRAFGENTWADYEVRFKARVPDTAKQVQICAGFRAANRDDRYILLLKGGMQKFLYLARLGYMGNDDYLALRELDFHPEPGQWYAFKIQVAGSRIRVFLNDESLPRIDITDRFSNYAAAGKITLGGSWIANEFEDLSITSIDKAALDGLPVQEYAPPAMDKDSLRRQQRAAYSDLRIKDAGNGRKEISLDGKWLFAPGYEIADENKAVQPGVDDKNWHVMTVPDFWNPSRVWLYGEKYGSGGKGVADNYYQKETDRCEAYSFDYKRTDIGWYRQWIDLPPAIKGKNLQLSFDAVSKIAEVWINGIKARDHIGMFGDFQIDASQLLKPGRNLLVVKVTRDYSKDMADADKIAAVAVTVEVTQKMVKDLPHGFFVDDPAGIWQPVSLIITNPLRIEDVYIKPGLTGADFEITVKNHTAASKTFSITTAINGVRSGDLLYKGSSLKNLSLEPGGTRTFTYTISDLKPRLWSPEHPNLYDFSFALLSADGKRSVDDKTIRSGFRTFKAIGDYLYLNDKRYWLRGGNQTAMSLAPNDPVLADTFCKIMKAGNIMITRSHTVPYDETWLNASDENGIGVSYEGTWPWLFLASSMPDQHLIDLWREEFLELLKKYRNHPSLLFWTVNNEMKFYDNDPDLERAKVKMRIISAVVKQMRAIDPTRPIVFDSNYKRNLRRFGADFFKTVDDGDIEDPHAYINWYDGSLFNEFNGEWQKRNRTAGRPLISQEMSTGYTDETGHATRFYNYVHQNPEALAGKYTYEYNDPVYFLKPQAFITKELAEALRRSNDHAAGILHFSAVTWFSNAYLADKITPFPVYYDMKQALQPVLVSAELWGRHFYAGTALPAKICVINDQEDGNLLPSSMLDWELVSEGGVKIAEGRMEVPEVEPYGRQWIDPRILIPKELPSDRVDGKLMLKLTINGTTVSENSYDLLFMNRAALQANRLEGKNIVILEKDASPGKDTIPGKGAALSGSPGSLLSGLDFLGIKVRRAASLSELVNLKADVYILSGLDPALTAPAELVKIKDLIGNGAKILMSGTDPLGQLLYPQYIRGMVPATDNGEVVTMEIPESDIFDSIEPLDTRYFNDNKRELPAVLSGAFQINRSPNLLALASFTRVHGYLSGNIPSRMARLDKIKGFPIVKIHDGPGTIILSEMLLQKSGTDPVAGKLLVNMISDLLR